MSVGNKRMVSANDSLWEYLKEGFLNLIYPLNCESCGSLIKESKGYSICDECLKSIRLITPPFCYHCGKPFSPEVNFEEKAICNECSNKKQYYNFARSIAYYEGVLRKCIHLFKYQGQVKIAKPLADLIINYFLENNLIPLEEIDLIIPVPLFKDELTKRGFNQSGLLAKLIASHYSIPFSEELLIKKRANLSQVGLTKTERKDNVKNVYAINADIEKDNIFSVLLIDDIFTTGASIEACCKELNKTRIKKLYVLTLARNI